MPFDLHVHGPLVQQSGWTAIRPDGPRAVVEVPRTFVAEENLLRVSRRALQVIRPIVLAVNHAEFARLGVYRVNHLRRTGRPLGLKRATRASFGRHARNDFALGVGGNADQKRLVAVDRELVAARGERERVRALPRPARRLARRFGLSASAACAIAQAAGFNLERGR